MISARLNPAARLKPGHGLGEDRLSDGCDAGEELLAVVVVGQLRRHLMRERVLRRVELRPFGDGGRLELAADAFEDLQPLGRLHDEPHLHDQSRIASASSRCVGHHETDRTLTYKQPMRRH